MSFQRLLQQFRPRRDESIVVLVQNNFFDKLKFNVVLPLRLMNAFSIFAANDSILRNLEQRTCK